MTKSRKEGKNRSVRPLRILIVEDSRPDAELSLHELRKADLNVQADVVLTVEEFLKQIRSVPYDVVLSDYKLPGWTGLDAFEELKRERKDIPFILITGTLGEEAAVECMKRGITDYILKQNLTRLPRAVTRAVEERKISQERNRAERSLRTSKGMFRGLLESAADAIVVHSAGKIEFSNTAGVKLHGARNLEELIGNPVLNFLPPMTQPTFLEKLRKVRERTARVPPLETPFRALEDADLFLLMNEAATVLAQVLEVEYAQVLELLPDEKALLLRAGVGLKEGLVGHATVGAGTVSEAGYTLLSNEPVITEDLGTEERFSGPPLLHDHGVVSGMSVIIPETERPFGILGVHTTKRRKFSKDDIYFLQAIAHILATAIRRRRAQSAPGESGANPAEAERIAHLGSWNWNIVKNKLWWWDGVYRNFGLSGGESAATSEAFLSTVHADDAEFVRNSIDKPLQEGKPSSFDHRILLPDGTKRVVHEEAEVQFDSAHRPARRVGKVQDITESRRVEESLRHLSGRLLQLQDEERRRLARELHDSTAQTLAALEINLNVVSRSSARLTRKARQAMEESLGLAAQCAREVRNISYFLHPPLLDEAGLATALRSYVDGFTRRSRIRVELDIDDKLGRLSQDQETTLFRIAQEGLSNIHRHSGSSKASVQLTANSKKVTLEVSDEGRGIPPPLLKKTGLELTMLGMGISGMRERARQLGGGLEIRSGKKGTTVRVTLPRKGSLP